MPKTIITLAKPGLSPYNSRMAWPVAICMFVALGAVVVTLGLGVYGMARGGEFNQKYGNRLMRLRVILQGVALLLFILAAALAHKGS
jgi:hypothetical protein